MKTKEVVRVMGASAQGTRLDAFRLLAQAGPEGMFDAPVHKRRPATPKAGAPARLSLRARF